MVRLPRCCRRNVHVA